MYEPDDVARSIRRYLGSILEEGPPPDWTVRLERREVSDDERPVGVVLLGDVTTIQARETFDQGNVVDLYPVTVYLYPRVGETAQVARREGDVIRSLGHQLLKYGVPLEGIDAAYLGDDDRPKAGPFHIPLWNWDGVAAEDEENREPPEVAQSTMRIPRESLSAQNLDDPDDERRRSVVLEFRVEVEMPGRIDDRADGGVVTGLPGHFGGEPS